jgi:D-beta-D-heptose 7-phosphate kinase/D-beta-D-heptose 1-phosphate adenosyltransferase
VLGDSCEDIYHYGTCERLSPEAPVPILKTTNVDTKPGMCLNVAENIKGLGFSVNILTHKTVIKKHRFIEEKKMVHLLRVDDETCQVDELVIDDFMELNSSCSYDAFVISDYDKGFIRHGTIKHVIQYALKKTIPVFVDTKKKDVSCFENCIIKVNQQEEERIQTLPPKGSYELITTLGSSGARWKNRIFPTKKVIMHDVCGAGDTFLAALTYEYLISGSLETAIKFANECASTSVSHFGNYVIGS